MKKFIGMVLGLLFAASGCAQKLSGSWSGLLNAGVVKLHLVFNIQNNQDGETICWMDSPDQAAKGIPTKVLFISSDSVSIEIPMIGAKYNGKLSGKTIAGIFEQMGHKLPLDLTNTVLKYNRPQHPTAPYPYSTEEVTFTNPADQVTLAGTLTYPVGYQEGQKVPVVLMVTGSGPENRDEEIYEHKPFLVIADFLAKNGIASLRYDDRHVGKSTGEHVAATTKTVAEDAKAGVDFLRLKSRFSQVGVLGHSEGGTVGFILGADQAVDFIVSLAGAGVKGADCLYAQAQKVSEVSGQPFTMNQEQFVQMIAAQKNPWLDYFVSFNPLESIRRTTCPVFALNGDKDVQVIASQNLTSIEKNLPKNDRSKVKLYPGLNHLFQECQTGLPQEYSTIEQTISPSVLKDIAAWIHSL